MVNTVYIGLGRGGGGVQRGRFPIGAARFFILLLFNIISALFHSGRFCLLVVWLVGCLLVRVFFCSFDCLFLRFLFVCVLVYLCVFKTIHSHINITFANNSNSYIRQGDS